LQSRVTPRLGAHKTVRASDVAATAPVSLRAREMLVERSSHTGTALAR
jgi:hypothetical protein